MGQTLTAESASYGLVPDHRTGGLLTVFLALRAFASGCTALTGVEAVSNGVPSFEEPKSRNAATTLTIMGALAIIMFAGITALAVVTHVHMAEDPSRLIGLPAGQEQRTALSQIGLAVFGGGPAFYLLQAFTAAILVLAANTAYNGFPVLASLLARDGHLPRQLARRGDRLVFSNGIVLLAAVAAVLIVAFDADVTRLIQLYIIGVFVSFTLSARPAWCGTGAGNCAPTSDARARRRMRRSQAINATGAVATDRRPGPGAGHQVHPRRLDRGDRDAAAVPADAADPPALRHGRRRGRPAPGRRDAAQPHPRRGPGGEDQRADAAHPGVRPRHPPRRPDRGHRPRRPGRDRPAVHRVGRAATSRCR